MQYMINEGAETMAELPALQEPVAELDVSDCIVTADAMHCQKKTCKAIIKGRAATFSFLPKVTRRSCSKLSKKR